MPETSSTWCGNRSNWEHACFIEARMPKSPQAGHHVGCSSLLKSLISDMREYSLFDLSRDFVARVRPPVIFQDLVGHIDARHHADDQSQLARVVVLDVHDLPCHVQDLLGAGDGQGPDLVVVQVIDLE